MFLYVAHFNNVQSWILAGVSVCAIEAYRATLKIAEKTPPSFGPFSVSIQPNWYALCKDFGLYDIGNWNELRAGSSEYTILRDGLNFTMLTPTLFYSNDHKTFFGKLDLRVPAEELKPEHSEQRFLSFSPHFYVKRSVAGNKKNIRVIEFGLITEESLKKSHYPGDPDAEMPLARLPEIVFFGYMHPDACNYGRIRKIEQQTTSQLAKFGWTQKEREPEDSLLNWPYEITHKYVAVTYRQIS